MSAPRKAVVTAVCLVSLVAIALPQAQPQSSLQKQVARAAQAIERSLAGRLRAEGERGTVIVVLDDALAAETEAKAVLLALRSTLAATALHRDKRLMAGAILLSGKPVEALKPTADLDKLPGVTREMIRTSSHGYKNALQAVREAVKLAETVPGPRAILLVTPENADNEDDLEATARILNSKHAAF